MPTTFLRLIGIDNIPETVHAQACSPCGAVPLDVMIVLDRTGSMTGSKLDSAKQGVLAFMRTMDPTTDNVGLAVLPPAPTSAAACSATATNAYDSPSAAYVLVPLNGDYASTTGNLNSGSELISTINCVQAGGQTAYANALEAAQDEIDADGRDGTQKVIIILSDGAANKGPGYLPPTSPYRTNPCQTAVDIAGDSKAKGVLMYSIAYDVSGDGAQDCGKQGGDESPPILANEALQEIASPGQLLRRAAALLADRDLPGHLGRPRTRHLPPQRLVGTGRPAAHSRPGAYLRFCRASAARCTSLLAF